MRSWIREAWAGMDTEKVKDYIGLNLRSVCGVAPLAADLQISPDKLRKEFRRKEGLPLSRFILITKVENAKKLLADTDRYCFEICFDVGFSREDVGARIFKRVTGMTMLQYRESARDGRPR